MLSAKTHNKKPSVAHKKPHAAHKAKKAHAKKAKKTPLRAQQRSMAFQAEDSSISIVSAMYETTGNPLEVMHLQEQVIQNPKGHLPGTKVFVKTLASPINPADINLIEGTYGIPSKPPAIAGNEGVFEVITTGPDSNLKPGDWVVPVFPGYGTWRSHVIGDSVDFLAVPKDVVTDPVAIATLMVNPCTAYRILEDFAALKSDGTDFIVQNGANSGVGRAIIQLSKLMNVNTINIIRQRDTPEATEALIAELKELGATHVLTDNQLRDREFIKSWVKTNNLPSQQISRLGVNCVGGTAVADLCRFMAPHTTVVTYGGMSKKPAMIGTGSFIFNDLTFKGFWMTRWNQEHPPNDPVRKVMLAKLFTLLKEGKLHQKSEVHQVKDTVSLLTAIDAALTPQKTAKVVLDWSAFTNPGNDQKQ